MNVRCLHVLHIDIVHLFKNQHHFLAAQLQRSKSEKRITMSLKNTNLSFVQILKNERCRGFNYLRKSIVNEEHVLHFV